MNSSRLVLRLMCDVAERGTNSDAEVLFDLEYDLVEGSVSNDDFATASTNCQALSQRHVDIYGKRHHFCIMALYLRGFWSYAHL